ncbi:MAG TPA: hypothetical protein VL994_07195, partial [Steroidobacteraceae bacterium]|nr:hypothetical protein [Steroidobacteraceae bacterium]
AAAAAGAPPGRRGSAIAHSASAPAMSAGRAAAERIVGFGIRSFLFVRIGCSHNHAPITPPRLP